MECVQRHDFALQAYRSMLQHCARHFSEYTIPFLFMMLQIRFVFGKNCLFSKRFGLIWIKKLCHQHNFNMENLFTRYRVKTLEWKCECRIEFDYASDFFFLDRNILDSENNRMFLCLCLYKPNRTFCDSRNK